MNAQFTLYSLPLCLAAVLSALVAAYGVTRRRVPGAWAFTLLFAAAAFWAAMDALAITTRDVLAYTVFVRLKFGATAVIPWAWFAFALHFTGRGHRASWPRLALLSLLPLLIAILVWVPGGRDLVARNWTQDMSGPLPTQYMEPTPLFWLYTGYCYVLIATGTVLLVARLAGSWQLYRRQALLVAGASLIPWVASASYLLGLNPVKGLDPTPVGFCATGLLFSWGLLRARLLDITPLAHGAVFAGLSDAVLVLDARGRLVDLNPAAMRLFARAEGAVIGQPLEAIPGEAGAALATALAGSDYVEEFSTGPEEDRRYHEVRLTLLTGASGEAAGQLVILRDITETRQARIALTFQAHHDELTGLLNRSRLLSRLDEVVQRGGQTGEPFAFLLIDLDGFKEVNDSFGHHAGDLLLQRVAEQLRGVVRAEDCCARLGGDEFGILLPGARAEEAEQVARRLRTVLAEPVIVEGQPLAVNGSIGIVTGPRGGDASDLVRRADSAMYAAKRGHQGYTFDPARPAA